MNPDVIALLPLLAPVATLIVVFAGVLFSNRHVDVRIGDVMKLIASESARLEAVLKLDIEALAMRVKALEEREGLIVRTRG